MASTTDDSARELAAANQSCKECYRRKSRCDRGLPVCSLCLKYSRHCLYEKHARTPLTRRHLTDVEEKLEKAEALIRRLRRESTSTVDQASRNSAETRPLQLAPDSAFDFCEMSPPRKVFEGASRETPEQDASARSRQRRRFLSNATSPSADILEKPPQAQDDFEWDELEVNNHTSPESATSFPSESVDQIKDGMASLAVDERDAGYLGVASGAALLRILEPGGEGAPRASFSSWRAPALSANPGFDLNRHIADAFIDGYFSTYHLLYPLVHQPTFRGQLTELIPRPNGLSWTILAYILAAIGVFCSSTTTGDLDRQLFSHAKSMLTFDILETGNLTLVQALTLISNYIQKINKPNSGWNYLGLASRMATGLGLHKEFQGWNISVLQLETRRRLWYTLAVFDEGATITFSRPLLCPRQENGVDVKFPSNVTDRELTASSTQMPPENIVEITPYTAVICQARFHTSSSSIYSKIISKPIPTSDELLSLEETLIQPWRQSIPAFFNESAPAVPLQYSLAHSMNQWRYLNFLCLMYRPFVIRSVLNSREGRNEDSPADVEAINRCLHAAQSSIVSIEKFWANNAPNRLAAWYALYFLFQAALIPVVCLRNKPNGEEAASWRHQLTTTMQLLQSLAALNPSSTRCYRVIDNLCGAYLRGDARGFQSQAPPDLTKPEHGEHEQPIGGDDTADSIFDQIPGLEPVEDSPQTQMNQIAPMMWPNLSGIEAHDVMGDDSWLEFLRGGGGWTDES